VLRLPLPAELAALLRQRSVKRCDMTFVLPDPCKSCNGREPLCWVVPSNLDMRLLCLGAFRASSRFIGQRSFSGMLSVSELDKTRAPWSQEASNGKRWTDAARRFCYGGNRTSRICSVIWSIVHGNNSSQRNHSHVKTSFHDRHRVDRDAKIIGGHGVRFLCLAGSGTLAVSGQDVARNATTPPKRLRNGRR
jgi:hypothetical protein